MTDKELIGKLDAMVKALQKPYKITSTGMKGQVYGIDAHPYFQIWKGDMEPYKEP